MVVMKVGRALTVVASVISSAGCATYHSNYGRFTAENSSGETRDYLLSWQTADYPDWWLMSDRSTPVTLQTQCSERLITFVDDSNENWNSACRTAEQPLVWCGDAGQDRRVNVTAQGDEPQICGWIRSEPSAQRIVDLGTDLEVIIRCEPVQPSVGSGEEQRNFDYLQASPVPYAVAVKRVLKGGAQDYRIKLDERVCKSE